MTGRPFTLLRNGKVQSSGAIGLATPSRPTEHVLDCQGLIRLTESMQIRNVEGNLIQEVGDSLPARILVKAIQDYGLPDDQAKNVDYYIGVRDQADIGTVSDY